MTAAEYWSSAATIDEYVGQMWRKNRKTLTRNRERTGIDDATRAVFAGRSLRILILTEHYCEDSMQLVPVIWRLAEELESIEARVLRQHQHPDLASRYVTAGHPAIPVFILMDEQLREVGSLVERPERMTAELTAEMRHFQKTHPEMPGIQRAVDPMPDETRAALKQHIASWRDDQHDHWAQYLLEDLADLIA
jgi:hypothetical protein